MDAQYNLTSGAKFGDFILSTFYDYGEIKQYKDTYDIVMTSPNEYSLEGWGVALDFLTMNRLNLKVIWADAIGDNPGKTISGMNSDGKNNSSRIWAMARVQLLEVKSSLKIISTFWGILFFFSKGLWCRNFKLLITDQSSIKSGQASFEQTHDKLTIQQKFQ